ncbi:TPA: phage tail tape measure protein, partial [Stenotrophomonas maltophilia]|nr:phage tail tape measure protein [Stenotrophomonas maltophilia]
SVFSGLEDVWVKFTQTGKVSFSDLTRSVLADLARIQLRQALTGMGGSWMSGVLGALSGGLNSTGNAAVTMGTSSINDDLFQKMRGFTPRGFTVGGYTGPGGVNEPAGIVHKGEVVWSQADIARAGGLGVVEAMRRGLRGYAEGGLVGAMGAGGPIGGAVNIKVSNAPAGTTATASRNGSGGLDIDVLLGQVDQFIGGRIAGGTGSSYSAIKGRFGLGDSI